MRTYIVLLSVAAVCLTLNSPVLATDRLVPSQYSTLEVLPVSLNYDAEAYAYADKDEIEQDIAFSTNGEARAQAHAHFQYVGDPPCYDWRIEDSYADNSVEGVSAVEGAWLISTLKGWGEYSGGDDCTGYTYGGTGSGVGGGYTSLAGTIGIDISFTIKLEAAIDGSSPGSWESWDWWCKIWDDDANNPVVVLNDSNMSANLDVLAGQILNVELYHEGGTYSWPESGLESTLTIGLIVGPIMEVFGTEFWFDAKVGGSNPEPQTLTIRNIGAGTLDWEINEECDWLSAEPSSGSSTGDANEVAVNVDISGLATGLYNCEFTVSGEGATGSPQTIEVTLFVHGGYLHVPEEFGTIQEAIDVAVDGETVIVEPNTYTGPGNKNLDYGGKAITVRSIDPEDPCVVVATVIDCQNSGRGFYFHSGEEANSVLAGFTIKRGVVSGDPAMGGGIYCSGASPTIENCIIRNNRANGDAGSYPGGNGRRAYGGGVYNTSGIPRFVKCTISDNTASGGPGGDSDDMGWPGMGGRAYGGGLYGSGITIEDCTLSNNKALGGRAGNDHGMLWSGEAGDAYGGGIYGSLEVSSTVISGNTAHGGVFLYDGFPGAAYGGGLCGGSTIENCLIIENVAEDSDEGYWDNSGGGAYGAATITNTTICNNVAPQDVGGVAGATTVINCILWGNGDDLGGCVATYSCIEDGDAGEGNISDNPRFVSGPLGNYYLSQIAAGQAVDSPCVDAGSDTAVNLGMDIFTTRTDELKDTSIADMGYHYSISPGSPDIDGDYDVDFFDYAILTYQWKQIPGVPSADIAPPGGDGVVDVKDLAFLVEYWLWGK